MVHSSSTLDELREPLRRLTFPACASECLNSILAFVQQRSRFFRELQVCLDEFFFFSLEQRRTRPGGVAGGTSSKPTRLTSIQELQLLMTICHFYRDQLSLISEEDKVRSQFFVVLFCATRESDANVPDARLPILCKVTSLAIQLRCRPFLTDLSQWMLRTVHGKVVVKQICSRVVDDFLVTGRDHQWVLDMTDAPPAVSLQTEVETPASDEVNVPTGAAGLAALTLITLFMRYQTFDVPENGILEAAVNFLGLNSLALISAYKQAMAHSSSIHKSIQHTISCLSAICILGPFEYRSSTVVDRLHAALLQFLLNATALTSVDKRACSLMDYAHIADCMERVAQMSESKASQVADIDRRKHLAVDRIAQLLQVCKHSDCLAGNLMDVIKAYKALCCEHTLLDYVLFAE